MIQQLIHTQFLSIFKGIIFTIFIFLNLVFSNHLKGQIHNNISLLNSGYEINWFNDSVSPSVYQSKMTSNLVHFYKGYYPTWSDSNGNLRIYYDINTLKDTFKFPILNSSQFSSIDYTNGNNGSIFCENFFYSPYVKNDTIYFFYKKFIRNSNGALVFKWNFAKIENTGLRPKLNSFDNLLCDEELFNLGAKPRK